MPNQTLKVFRRNCSRPRNSNLYRKRLRLRKLPKIRENEEKTSNAGNERLITLEIENGASEAAEGEGETLGEEAEEIETWIEVVAQDSIVVHSVIRDLHRADVILGIETHSARLLGILMYQVIVVDRGELTEDDYLHRSPDPQLPLGQPLSLARHPHLGDDVHPLDLAPLLVAETGRLRDAAIHTEGVVAVGGVGAQIVDHDEDRPLLLMPLDQDHHLQRGGDLHQHLCLHPHHRDLVDLVAILVPCLDLSRGPPRYQGHRVARPVEKPLGAEKEMQRLKRRTVILLVELERAVNVTSVG